VEERFNILIYSVLSRSPSVVEMGTFYCDAAIVVQLVTR